MLKNDPAYIVALQGLPNSFIPILIEQRRAKEQQKEALLIKAQRERLDKIALVQAQKLNREAERQEQQRISREAERRRESAGQPALSRAEAKRRGLETYLGRPCTKGHTGERSARIGECLVCRGLDKSIRAAMKRGAFPENLNPDEREQILAIYKMARDTSKATGIPHHVDHIVPLAAGGRHHPSNLQVLTAEDNLKKGAKLKWPQTPSTRKASRSREKVFDASLPPNESRAAIAIHMQKLSDRARENAANLDVQTGRNRANPVVAWLFGKLLGH